MVRSRPILVFFDSSTSCCFISGSSSASHYILIRMDASWRLLPKVGVVITCVIGQIVPMGVIMKHTLELGVIQKSVFRTYLG